MTNISEVYDVFLSKISDYSLLNPDLTDADLNEDLFSYFRSARAKFYKCKQSLNTEEDELGELIIESDLTPYEIEIIVKLMTVEYMTLHVLSSEVIKQSISDKDFKIHSQANQLRELSLLYRQLQKEANRMISEYSYMGMTDE